LRGAYAVRGGAADTDSVVFSRPLTMPFSGIGPDSVNPAAPWAPMLNDSNPAPRRILVYGMPGSSSKTFDWRVAPRSAVFSPPAVVAVCVNPDTNVNATKLLHQQNVGNLPFVHALWLNLATCSPTSVVARSVAGPLQFALGAVHWGINLLAPSPLSATNATIVDGLGGTTGGLHSEFGPEQVDTVVLAFVVQPKDVQVNQTHDTVVVRATNQVTGATVANVTVVLTAVNNNGQPAGLEGDTTQVTDYSGLATFTDWSEMKTGGYVLIATGSVGGRSAIFVVQSTSTRFNVRP
jgi:hypothetical protein